MLTSSGFDAAANIKFSMGLAINAANRAGVKIRELNQASEMISAAKILASVWGLDTGQMHIDPGLMTAMAHAGNYVAGAYQDGQIIGASVGFFAEPLGRALHSHITGVDPAFADRGIGTALKQHQRVWCLERGLTEIVWTFDPLISRNAYLNIHHLGARPTEYLVDFYGAMDDGFNAGQPSDRMLLRWDLTEPDTRQSTDIVGKPLVLTFPEVGPLAQLDPGRDGPQHCQVKIPSDIAQMRGTNTPLALWWRESLRRALSALMSAGWQITDFDRTGFYVLERN
jgi:predicted GNAT superfamily acetyltransferase